MKKIICLILALVFCFGLSACKKNADTPKTDVSQTYTQAKEKTDSLTSFDATMNVDVKYTTGDSVAGNRSVVHTQLDRRDPEAPVYYNKYDINDYGDGKNYSSSTYYADNVVYEMSAIGEKYMMKVAVESIESAFANVAIDIPADVFKQAVVKDDKVSVTTEAENISELSESFLAGVTNSYSSVNGDGEFDFDYSDVAIEFATDDNGYFEYISISYSADFAALEGDSHVDVSLNMTYNDPGKDVDIVPPDDLSEYTWYEEDQKTQEELEGEMMEEILAMFIFEDGKATRVENYDELYAIACSKYTKETVDMYVQTIEVFGSLGN